MIMASWLLAHPVQHMFKFQRVKVGYPGSTWSTHDHEPAQPSPGPDRPVLDASGWRNCNGLRKAGGPRRQRVDQTPAGDGFSRKEPRSRSYGGLTGPSAPPSAGTAK